MSEVLRVEQLDYSTGQFVNILVLGEQGCGKTLFCESILGNIRPLNEYKPTFGLDVYNYRIPVPAKRSHFSLWDISGGECSNPQLKNALVRADCIIFMYDITDMSSFVKLHKWIKRCTKDLRQLPLFVLAGNKVDLLHERQVSPDLHKQLFQEHKFRLDCLLSCQDHSKALELLKSIGNVLMPLHKEHY